MITVEQALEIILTRVAPLGNERIDISAALGRLLAENVVADIDLPPFDRARMDGYAVRSVDLASVPAELEVLGEVAAGSVFHGSVGHGQAVKIFTGAPLPEGADAVQKVEVTENRNGKVLIKESVVAGQFVTRRSSEVACGEVVAPAGSEITPAELSVLASFGKQTVAVGIRPRVAVMSTGTELVEISELPRQGQIRNSNSYTISGYATRAGAATSRLPTVPDSEAAIALALAEAAEHNEIVITSGGVSMGDYDLVKAALHRIGATIYFDKVILRPGKPTVFAQHDKTFFFGLPGNPVSTSVTFNLFVWPAIRKMQGDPTPLLPGVQAELFRSIKDSSDRRSYLPGRLSVAQGRALVEPLKWSGSSDLVAFMSANALIVVPAETHELQTGDLVDVILMTPF